MGSPFLADNYQKTKQVHRGRCGRFKNELIIDQEELHGKSLINVAFNMISHGAAAVIESLSFLRTVLLLWEYLSVSQQRQTFRGSVLKNSKFSIMPQARRIDQNQIG